MIAFHEVVIVVILTVICISFVDFFVYRKIGNCTVIYRRYDKIGFWPILPILRYQYDKNKPTCLKVTQDTSCLGLSKSRLTQDQCLDMF
jgi:hypothetical protein